MLNYEKITRNLSIKNTHSEKSNLGETLKERDDLMKDETSQEEARSKSDESNDARNIPVDPEMRGRQDFFDASNLVLNTLAGVMPSELLLQNYSFQPTHLSH